MATTRVAPEPSTSPQAELLYGPVPSVVQQPVLAERFEKIVRATEFAADFVALVVAGAIVYWLQAVVWQHHELANLHPRALIVGYAFLFVLMLDRVGLYQPASSLLRVRETERVLRVATSFTLLGVITAVTRTVSISCVVLLTVTSVVLLLLEKAAADMIIRMLHARGIGNRKAVILGAGHTGRRVFAALARSPRLGIDPVGIVDRDLKLAGKEIFAPGYRRQKSLVVSPEPLNREFIAHHQASVVICAIPSLERSDFLALVSQANSAGAQVAFVPGQHMPSEFWVEHFNVDGLLLGAFQAPADRNLYAVAKRALDLLVCITVIFVSFPIWLLLALFVKFDSDGPIFFVQTRVGKDGRLFRCVKFRTMRVTAPSYQRSPSSSSDPRITRVGKFLRKTSLDELPQLINVLIGDMSVVGPRPEMPFIVAEYNSSQRSRLCVKPGITGLWQISADRAFPIHENIEYDLYYLRNRNFFMDLAILLHTAVFAMRGT